MSQSIVNILADLDFTGVAISATLTGGDPSAQIHALAESHQLTEEEVVEKIMLEPMPKRVFITIEEVAGAVEFLLSDAARNITGQTIVIDGGWTAR